MLIGHAEETADLRVTGFVGQPSHHPAQRGVPLVIPTPSLGNGLQHLQAAPQPFSDAGRRSPGSSSDQPWASSCRLASR